MAQIFHIYWGTAGNSGLYLDEIYQVLKKTGYEQIAFVSAYFPFNYGEKIFFPKSEMEHCKVHGVRRKLLQALEFGKALLLILSVAKKKKPSIINFSLISFSYPGIFHFLKCIKKKSGCKLIITCHDVKPFVNEGTKSYKREMINRKAIFNYADYLLVHNENSISDLQKLFNIGREKVIMHKFPIMDLSKLSVNTVYNKKYDFLFIGQMRSAKGIRILVNAWHEFHKQYPHAKLCLAGNPLDNFFDISLLESENVECHLYFIPDNEYVKFISSSRFVILPYTYGTNSGIISTVLSVGTNVITSDIPMFLTNPFVSHEDMFTSEDVGALVSLMGRKYLSQDTTSIIPILNTYREQFRKEVLSVYNGLLNDRD